MPRIICRNITICQHMSLRLEPSAPPSRRGARADGRKAARAEGEGVRAVARSIEPGVRPRLPRDRDEAPHPRVRGHARPSGARRRLGIISKWRGAASSVRSRTGLNRQPAGPIPPPPGQPARGGCGRETTAAEHRPTVPRPDPRACDPHAVRAISAPRTRIGMRLGDVSLEVVGSDAIGSCHFASRGVHRHDEVGPVHRGFSDAGCA